MVPEPKHEAQWRWASLCLAGIVLGATGLAGYSVRLPWTAPAERSFLVTARSFAFDPAVITVKRGDRVTLRFASADVVHGFYLEGYDVDVTIHPGRRRVEVARPAAGELSTVWEVSFIADTPGRFRYRCSTACGAMHRFMVGELLVEPNWLWPVSALVAGGLLIAGGLLAGARTRVAEGAQVPACRFSGEDASPGRRPGSVDTAQTTRAPAPVPPSSAEDTAGGPGPEVVR